jgi:hypothetical protein
LEKPLNHLSIAFGKIIGQPDAYNIYVEMLIYFMKTLTKNDINQGVHSVVTYIPYKLHNGMNSNCYGICVDKFNNKHNENDVQKCQEFYAASLSLSDYSIRDTILSKMYDLWEASIDNNKNK